MNDQGEKHQSLDIGLLRYSSDEIGVRHVTNAIPDKITKATKEILIEESNPAEIYLYDQPQDNVEQGKDGPVETRQPVTGNNYGDDKNTTNCTKHNNDTNNSNNSNSGNTYSGNRDNNVNNDNNHEVNHNNNNHNVDLPSTLTPLKHRDQHAYGGGHHYPQDKGLDQGSLTAVSHGSSMPASQEMQSADTLLTRTSFDAKGINEFNDSTEQPFYVNAKQYYRILKRRYTRAKLEENLRISRERRPYLHESRHKHAMRRPRGQGGRFLTLAEIKAMKLKEGSGSSSPSVSLPPNIKSENGNIASQPRLIEQQGPKPKKLRPAGSNNR